MQTSSSSQFSSILSLNSSDLLERRLVVVGDPCLWCYTIHTNVKKHSSSCAAQAYALTLLELLDLDLWPHCLMGQLWSTWLTSTSSCCNKLFERTWSQVDRNRNKSCLILASACFKEIGRFMPVSQTFCNYIPNITCKLWINF